MVIKPKTRLRNARNRYLNPGALAQLRYSRATVKSCTNMGKKRVSVLDSDSEENDLLQTKRVEHTSPTLLPERTSFPSTVESIGGIKPQKLPGTSKTPRTFDWGSESRLESLPMDLLVKIVCHLHHDQLRAVFHVSRRIRKAVLLARQCHFNYTTPDRSRQEMLRMKTPLSTEHWPFIRYSRDQLIWNNRILDLTREMGRPFGVRSLTLQKLLDTGPPPSRLDVTETHPIADVLFQESAFPSRCVMLHGFPKPLKSLASNRFYSTKMSYARQ